MLMFLPQETFNIIKTNVCGILCCLLAKLTPVPASVCVCVCVRYMLISQTLARAQPTQTYKQTILQMCAWGSWPKCRKSFRQRDVAQKKEMRAKKRYVNDTAVAVGKTGKRQQKKPRKRRIRQWTAFVAHVSIPPQRNYLFFFLFCYFSDFLTYVLLLCGFNVKQLEWLACHNKILCAISFSVSAFAHNATKVKALRKIQ